jgi:hypothetical protein
MPRSTPVRPPEPEVVRFQFLVSSQWIDDQIIATGRRPSRAHRIEFDLSEIDSPDVRRRLLDAARACQSLHTAMTLDHPEDDPEAFLRAVESWLMLVGRGLGPDQFDADMQSWIAEFGSERLRRASGRGYKVNATYASERAAREFPRFWVHTHPDPIWTDRTDPSQKALLIEEKVLEAVAGRTPRLEVRIVWLREPPAPLEQRLDAVGEVFEPGEAIVVRPFLGRYALVLPLAWPRRDDDDA